MNINIDIQNYAERIGLDTIATGGGCDYVYRKLDNGWEVIISDPYDCSSPDTLDDPACITIYEDFSDSSEYFTSGMGKYVTFYVNSCQEAMAMVQRMDTSPVSAEEKLCAEYGEFLQARNFPSLSADDLLAEHGEQMKQWEKEYVMNFMDRWDRDLVHGKKPLPKPRSA
jgi:hypothetical protein